MGEEMARLGFSCMGAGVELPEGVIVGGWGRGVGEGQEGCSDKFRGLKGGGEEGRGDGVKVVVCSRGVGSDGGREEDIIVLIVFVARLGGWVSVCLSAWAMSVVHTYMLYTDSKRPRWTDHADL